MSNKDVLSLWKKISTVIADEIASNDDFASKMSVLLGSDDSAPVPKRKNRRTPAKIDPFALLEQGEDKLAEALAELDIEELKDVIAANGMDAAKLAMKWKDHDRLAKHIMDSTKRKYSRGAAFWGTQEQKENETPN